MNRLPAVYPGKQNNNGIIMSNKKADVYFSGSENELRVTVDVSDCSGFVDMLEKIIKVVKKHNTFRMEFNSIYIREEKR